MMNDLQNSQLVESDSESDSEKDICWAEQHRTNGYLCTVSRISKKRSSRTVMKAQGRSDVYTVIIYLSRYEGHEMWCDDRKMLLASQNAGCLCIYDGMHEWKIGSERPCECIIFHLPRAALNVNADENVAWELDMQGDAVRVGLHDPVMHCLSQALDAICSKSRPAQEACRGHILSAVIAHLVNSYGRRLHASLQEMGRLAPWQIRRTREMMAASPDGRIGVVDLADACRLSPSHFTLLFKRTVGTTPHQWLLDRRIDQAKNLLRDSNGSLIEIAYATGFADQSHFTRVFSQRVSSSPLAWRRRHRADHSIKALNSAGLVC